MVDPYPFTGIVCALAMLVGLKALLLFLHDRLSIRYRLVVDRITVDLVIVVPIALIDSLTHMFDVKL